jgi:DNA polymerase-3 subunit delta
VGSSKSKKECEFIYVILGDEESLVNAQCAELINQLLEPEQRTLGLFDADPGSVTASAVLDELRTLPFLTQKRVVVLRGADSFISQNRELLEKYFDNPCPTGILVLTVGTWPAQTRLAKKLAKVGRLIRVKQPTRQQLPQRLVEYAKDAHDKKLSPDAAQLLIELTGDDVIRLYGEIDKLALFAQAEKVIKPQHVESLIGHNRLYNVFAVIDAVAAGETTRAIERLRKVFAEDRSAEYTIVGTFAYHFRRMFNAKVLLEKGIGERAVAERLRIWGDRRSFFSQLRRIPLRQLGLMLRQLASIDFEIKTGQTKPAVAAEQLVFTLAANAHAQ